MNNLNDHQNHGTTLNDILWIYELPNLLLNENCYCHQSRANNILPFMMRWTARAHSNFPIRWKLRTFRIIRQLIDASSSSMAANPLSVCVEASDHAKECIAIIILIPWPFLSFNFPLTLLSCIRCAIHQIAILPAVVICNALQICTSTIHSTTGDPDNLMRPIRSLHSVPMRNMYTAIISISAHTKPITILQMVRKNIKFKLKTMLQNVE